MMELGAVASATRDGVGTGDPDMVCGTCSRFVPCSIKRCGRGYWDVGVCEVRMERWRDGSADMSDCGRIDTDGIGCPDWEENG